MVMRWQAFTEAYILVDSLFQRKWLSTVSLEMDLQVAAPQICPHVKKQYQLHAHILLSIRLKMEAVIMPLVLIMASTLRWKHKLHTYSTIIHHMVITWLVVHTGF
jgi:hypothetical protein